MGNLLYNKDYNWIKYGLPDVDSGRDNLSEYMVIDQGEGSEKWLVATNGMIALCMNETDSSAIGFDQLEEGYYLVNPATLELVRNHEARWDTLGKAKTYLFNSHPFNETTWIATGFDTGQMPKSRKANTYSGTWLMSEDDKTFEWLGWNTVQRTVDKIVKNSERYSASLTIDSKWLLPVVQISKSFIWTEGKTESSQVTSRIVFMNDTNTRMMYVMPLHRTS